MSAVPPGDLLFALPVESGLVPIPCGHDELLRVGSPCSQVGNGTYYRCSEKHAFRCLNREGAESWANTVFEVKRFQYTLFRPSCGSESLCQGRCSSFSGTRRSGGPGPRRSAACRVKVNQVRHRHDSCLHEISLTERNRTRWAVGGKVSSAGCVAEERQPPTPAERISFTVTSPPLPCASVVLRLRGCPTRKFSRSPVRRFSFRSDLRKSAFRFQQKLRNLKHPWVI